MDRLRVYASRVWGYGRRIGDSFNRHLGGLMAAALSFYALLSLVPLLSVGVAGLGSVIGSSEQALVSVKQAIQNYLPVNGAVIYGTLSEVKRDRGLLGLIGLGGLLVSASAIFTNLEIAFNAVWHVERGRSWWSQRLAAVGTTLLALTLMLSSVAITSGMTYLENAHLPGLDIRAGQIPFLWQFVGHATPVVLSVLTFTVLYKIVPNRLVGWRAALVGGSGAGVAWEVAKRLFTFYAAHFANYNKVYGSLGALALLMVWAYYSMTILLLGAEVAAERDGVPPAPG